MTSDTGGAGTAAINTNYPIEDRSEPLNLISEEGSLVSVKDRVGL